MHFYDFILVFSTFVIYFGPSVTLTNSQFELYMLALMTGLNLNTYNTTTYSNSCLPQSAERRAQSTEPTTDRKMRRAEHCVFVDYNCEE